MKLEIIWKLFKSDWNCLKNLFILWLWILKIVYNNGVIMVEVLIIGKVLVKIVFGLWFDYIYFI